MVSNPPSAKTWSPELGLSLSLQALQTLIQVLRLAVVAIQRRRDSNCSDLLEALTQLHFRLGRQQKVCTCWSRSPLLQGLPDSTDLQPCPLRFKCVLSLASVPDAADGPGHQGMLRQMRVGLLGRLAILAVSHVQPVQVGHEGPRLEQTRLRVLHRPEAGPQVADDLERFVLWRPSPVPGRPCRPTPCRRRARAAALAFNSGQPSIHITASQASRKPALQQSAWRQSSAGSPSNLGRSILWTG